MDSELNDGQSPSPTATSAPDGFGKLHRSANSQEWTSGRMWRLCQKELRETLRDRRTIITLLLMPILLYPLLSIAMQRLFLSTMQPRGEITYTIGLASEQERDALGKAIFSGRDLLKKRPYQPIRIHRSTGRLSPIKDPDQPEVIGAEPDEPMLDVRYYSEDLELLLRERKIDLIVTAVPIEPAPWQRQGIQPVRFRATYVQNDRYSEEALSHLQRLLQVINDVEIDNRAMLTNRQPQGVVELIAEPTKSDEKESSAGLTTLIPLILLLMTITGAVYPAIDLTAGERERGTMESLIASPVPRFGLLLSKYVAVMTVAILTALVNLLSMWMTLWVTGIGKQLLGENGMSLSMMLQILPLLVVFACFFSAVLLALCSFAKSFKEAQAYLIPVMLVSLAPGVLSLMPGLKFTPWLAVVPLLNVILLARDILTGNAALVPAVTSVATTIIYAAASLSVAAKLFGADATSHGGQGTWSDLWRRPDQAHPYPEIGQMFVLLAILYPVYFISTNLLAQVQAVGLAQRLWMNASVTVFLFLLLPLAFSRLRRLDTTTTYRLNTDTFRWFPAAIGILLLGTSMWMVAHELFLFSQSIGIASISEQQIELAKKTKEQLLSIPFVVIVLTMAVLPAIAEEFFFRGFVLSSLRRSSVARQIVISGLLFGVFHVISSNTLSIERFLPTTFLGLVLGAVAVRTRSLYPGIFLHALHNGLLFGLSYYEEWFSSHGWGVEEQSQLPMAWLASGGIALMAGSIAILFSRRTEKTH